MGNAPGMTGALNAFLRITRGATDHIEIPSLTEFNLYQDLAALRTNGVTISAHALNRFSIDSGSVRAELQGAFDLEHLTGPVSGVDLSGTGSFTSTVNGWIPAIQRHGTGCRSAASSLPAARSLAREIVAPACRRGALQHIAQWLSRQEDPEFPAWAILCGAEWSRRHPVGEKRRHLSRDVFAVPPEITAATFFLEAAAGGKIVSR